ISHGNTYKQQVGDVLVESELDVALVSHSITGELKWTGYTEALTSDHIPGIITLENHRVKGPVYKIDWGKYRAALDNALKEGEEIPVATEDFDGALDHLVSNVQTAVKCACTRVTPRTTSHLAFWSVACQKATNARKAAYRKWCRTRTMESYLDYKRENARCRRFLKEQRRTSLEQLCQGLNEHCNMRLAWSLVHGVAGMGQVTGINSSQLLADLGVEEALKAAHEHFTELYTSLSNREAQDCEILITGRDECGAFTAPFSLDALDKALARRKKSTSPGEDGITYALLKSLPKAAKQRLLDLYN